ncbi:hypothetical protein ACX35G_000974 [Enterococcus faecalis]|uniref:hypothetical protein n=1 Tax=Enterococcus faecalis TaxID=1351 RepID=UPI002891A5CB|nr:hypothetical protein [Enterococcus faecalis]MDT2165443.1 hypothetical protein [Enterococcus faecalis]
MNKTMIENNDAYVLAQSENYIIINNNYCGLAIYDLELNFLKTVDILEGLLIYNIYSSTKDDKIIVFDAENEKLFLVNLNNYSNVIQINREEVFLNWFVSDKNWFALRDRRNEYQFSFKNGEELSRKQYHWQNNLSYNNEACLFEKNNKLYLSRNNIIRKVSQEYDETKHYSFAEDYIVAYDEDEIIVKEKDAEVTINISRKSNWIIRAILARENKIILLINDRMQVTKSKLIQCNIDKLFLLEEVLKNNQ